MAGIKLEGFQGAIPRVSDRLLPPMAASELSNTKLLQGELRGYRILVEEADFSAGAVSPVRRAYRIPDTPTDSYLTFDTRDVDIIRSPLVNDVWDRYFWTGVGTLPQMNSAANIKAGQVNGPYLLGVPGPGTGPTVTPPPGDGESDETRAYVYTFVSEFGEESQPSPPTLVTGDGGIPWQISNIASTISGETSRAFQGHQGQAVVKIYRTVPGNASTSFFYVGEVNYGVTSYEDNEANDTVASNSLLESTTWAPPVSSMEGFVVMPNGYLVGWSGRRLLFSEPYRPHAWPAEYELSTEFEIIGLGVVGGTLVVGTESQPYFGQGVSPASFTTQKVDAVEPCLSRRGVVSTTAGVLYPSINGLVLANSSGVRVITEDLFTKEEWSEWLPDRLYAAQLGVQYIAFNGPSTGFVLDPKEPAARFVPLTGFNDIEGIETDRYTGNVALLSKDRIWEWDSESTTQRMPWRWQSKMYQTPKPLNFGAARLQFITGGVEFGYEIRAKYLPYNTSLMTAIASQPGSLARLNTINGQVLGGSPAWNTGLVAGWSDAEIRQPLGGSLIYPIAQLSAQNNTVRVLVHVDYQNGERKTVFDRTIVTEDIFRLPTGFKSDLWQIELIGNTTVYSLQIAETPKQLAGI